uniref:UPAR/Ly6 domain-containing protein n=1 Tax=Salvator merianae TaxID=96440 RepID=A0A8D0BMH6_SALMN
MNVQIPPPGWRDRQDASKSHLQGVELYPLVCFTCERECSNWGCLTTRTCPEDEKYCETTVASFGFGFVSFGKRITKKCSLTCTESGMRFGLFSYRTSCCQSFLCNLFGFVAVGGYKYGSVFLGLNLLLKSPKKKKKKKD